MQIRGKMLKMKIINIIRESLRTDGKSCQKRFYLMENRQIH